VAHDFNNLLTVISSHTDLSLMDVGQDDPLRPGLEEIRAAVDRAATLTRQLLAFSRQQVLSPRILAPNDLIRGIEAMLGRIVGEDVDLAAVLDPEVGPVLADSGQLEQVVVNLVVNARDAMPDGGRLTIETSEVVVEQPREEGDEPLPPDAYVVVAVTDTGGGMDAGTKARIFEPFFTTKESGKGTGLGLSTVFGIVKQSGGFIRVYSEPGQGATFRVYLPRAEGPAEEIVAAHEGEVPRGTETVLLVEDDHGVRRAARAVLAQCGYRVLTAGNPEEAIRTFEENPGTIDLLMSDIVMPGGNGPELARRLREARPELRVLLVSGYADKAVLRHGVLEPGMPFLEKPFTPQVLARKVREVLDA
jgi:CheY-like chemotaxis protein